MLVHRATAIKIQIIKKNYIIALLCNFENLELMSFFQRLFSIYFMVTPLLFMLDLNNYVIALLTLYLGFICGCK